MALLNLGGSGGRHRRYHRERVPELKALLDPLRTPSRSSARSRGSSRRSASGSMCQRPASEHRRVCYVELLDLFQVVKALAIREGVEHHHTDGARIRGAHAHLYVDRIEMRAYPVVSDAASGPCSISESGGV